MFQPSPDANAGCDDPVDDEGNPVPWFQPSPDANAGCDARNATLGALTKIVSTLTRRERRVRQPGEHYRGIAPDVSTLTRRERRVRLVATAVLIAMFMVSTLTRRERRVRPNNVAKCNAGLAVSTLTRRERRVRLLPINYATTSHYVFQPSPDANAGCDLVQSVWC